MAIIKERIEIDRDADTGVAILELHYVDNKITTAIKRDAAAGIVTSVLRFENGNILPTQPGGTVQLRTAIRPVRALG